MFARSFADVSPCLAAIPALAKPPDGHPRAAGPVAGRAGNAHGASATASRPSGHDFGVRRKQLVGASPGIRAIPAAAAMSARIPCGAVPRGHKTTRAPVLVGMSGSAGRGPVSATRMGRQTPVQHPKAEQPRRLSGDLYGVNSPTGTRAPDRPRSATDRTVAANPMRVRALAAPAAGTDNANLRHAGATVRLQMSRNAPLSVVRPVRGREVPGTRLGRVDLPPDDWHGRRTPTSGVSRAAAGHPGHCPEGIACRTAHGTGRLHSRRCPRMLYSDHPLWAC